MCNVYRMQAVVMLVVDAVIGERRRVGQDVSCQEVVLADELLIAKYDVADEQSMAKLQALRVEINASAKTSDSREPRVGEKLSFSPLPITTF